MRFDLSGETQGVWFKFFETEFSENGDKTYLEPKEGEGEVCIRPMDANVLKDIRAKYNKRIEKFVHNPKTRAMERVLYDDQTQEQKEAENDAFWDYVIQDWKRLQDRDGNDIPCTAENKKLIMQKSIQFLSFATRCLQLVDRSEADKAEGAEKNS